MLQGDSLAQPLLEEDKDKDKDKDKEEDGSGFAPARTMPWAMAGMAEAWSLGIGKKERNVVCVCVCVCELISVQAFCLLVCFWVSGTGLRFGKQRAFHLHSYDIMYSIYCLGETCAVCRRALLLYDRAVAIVMTFHEFMTRLFELAGSAFFILGSIFVMIPSVKTHSFIDSITVLYPYVSLLVSLPSLPQVRVSEGFSHKMRAFCRALGLCSLLRGAIL